MDIDSIVPALIRDLPTTRHPLETVHRLTTPECDILFVVARAGFTGTMHSHDSDDVNVIVSGKMTITTEESARGLEAGDWYETRRGELHAIHADTDSIAIEFRFAAPRAASDD